MVFLASCPPDADGVAPDLATNGVPGVSRYISSTLKGGGALSSGHAISIESKDARKTVFDVS